MGIYWNQESTQHSHTDGKLYLKSYLPGCRHWPRNLGTSNIWKKHFQKKLVRKWEKKREEVHQMYNSIWSPDSNLSFRGLWSKFYLTVCVPSTQKSELLCPCIRNWLQQATSSLTFFFFWYSNGQETPETKRQFSKKGCRNKQLESTIS